MTFDATGLDPRGLAHDTVSRRFVLGDRKAGRLLIVDEVSHNLVNYVSAASAGFYPELTAFTLDARRGDLWVVSATRTGKGGAAASVLHKLQLVSGRALLEARTPGGLAGPLGRRHRHARRDGLRARCDRFADLPAAAGRPARWSP